MTRCLVVGAGGYVGTALVERLAGDGHEVRAMARGARPSFRPPAGVETVVGDATDEGDVRRALRGVEVVYYLVHSLSRQDFASIDREAAEILVRECASAGVRQIVYLGGARPHDGRDVSEHLGSRAEVGDILTGGGTPALVLQASMIIGAGSASFELLRTFTRLSPLVPRPGWMSRRSRPIAVDDVLHYLVTAAGMPAPVNGVFDLNGPESLSYLELVQRCARTLGLPWRLPVPVPVWSHELSAVLAGLVTSVPGVVARPLFRSLEHDLDTAEHGIARHIADPPGGLSSVDRAIARCAEPRPVPVRAGTAAPYVDARSVDSAAAPASLWRVIAGVGGDNGWYTLPLVWTLRGALDHALGGIGLYRGRPAEVSPGDAVDFWTVRECDPVARRLVLRADMRMPGVTTLTMRAVPSGDGGSRYEQTVRFRPRGVAGRLYWLLQKPAHDLVFSVMARNLVREAERPAPVG
ncbi:SDR family oxidoreductase [Amycolatopsis antarctica]|nr:SDR family oxidoreductase [Amycolatopsis antarctica]